MPSKNRIKQYSQDSFYHVYNRGVEKRRLFLDYKDYKYFEYLLEEYLAPVAKSTVPEAKEPKYRRKNYAQVVQLAAYCLMPNHTHFLIKQKTERGMAEFVHSIMISYVAYFNRRYSRVGGLFQDAYKALHVGSDELLIHESRYIHLNPQDLGVDYQTYPYSSYKSYVGDPVPRWLHPELVLSQFSGNGYAEFVAIQEKDRPFPRKGLSFSVSDFPEVAEVFREMLE